MMPSFPGDEMSVGEMLRLTCCMFGLQLVWSLIMVNGTPYLISLGLEQHLTSLVWIAGPLCGAFVQPLVGAHADQCTHRWGRRKPYIVGGAIATITSLLGLAYSPSVVPSTVKLLGASIDDDTLATVIRITAVVWIYLVNISIQPLQSGLRALIIEQSPTAWQPTANAWASRFTSLGNVFMCAVGLIDHEQWMSFGGDRFHSLVVTAVVVLTCTVSITCLSVQEMLSPLEVLGENKRGSTFGNLIDAFRDMPSFSKNVCRVQFVSWLGWFPVLFYNSSFIGNLYLSDITDGTRTLNNSDHDRVWHDAVRLGNFAAFIFAVVALTFSITLPPLMARLSLLNRTWLVRLWASSHILFVIAVFSTLFASNYMGGVMLMSLIGASWAVTIWVPFALIGYDVTRLADYELGNTVSNMTGRIVRRTEERIGGIMGLHNMAISAPQIASALMVSFLFYMLPYLGVEDVIGWVLRAGAVASLTAAFLIVQLDV